MGIMLPIKAYWLKKILCGEKTIEVRTTIPKVWKDYFVGKCEKPKPIKCFIYCTKSGKQLVRQGCLNASEEFALYDKSECKYCGCGTTELLSGKVVAKFTLKNVDEFMIFNNGVVQYWNGCDLNKTCLTYEQLSNYIGKNKTGYALNIDNLKIYDEPKKLSDFGLAKAPQSWCYMEEV